MDDFIRLANNPSLFITHIAKVFFPAFGLLMLVVVGIGACIGILSLLVYSI